MSKRRIVVAIAIVAVAGLAGIAVANDHACVTVQVGDPMILPDGSEQPAGRLTLCGAGAFSPVSHFQRTSVDGRPIGLFLSRPRPAEEASSGPPVVTFLRDETGRLLLVGYAVPSSQGTKAYVFDDAWRLVARGRGRAPWAEGGSALTMVASAR